MAMHHGSLDNSVRRWVEDALQAGKLKLVVCTSSLDLGVDFRPVETIVQVGGPKGVSRFMQRAGRSGHQPGALSRIYFVPTHALELVEGAALKMAVGKHIHENRSPLKRSLDVLVQYLVTLSVGHGFKPVETLHEIRTTYAYADLTDAEWKWALNFITTGGASLRRYEEFSKVEVQGGLYKVDNRRISSRHRLSIGTIVEDPVLQVKFTSGRQIGTIEESFISMLSPGDTFWFAGRCLEFVRMRNLTAFVVKARTRRGRIPAWQGGRLPLSSKLSELIRSKLEEARQGHYVEIEMKKLAPLLQLQKELSDIPARDILLIEYMRTREGHHLYIYPFEGRFVHEVMASLIAYRISKIEPISFSIAMNDYGFELLSDQEIPIEAALELDLFSTENLLEDIEESINQSEMAKRKFRDIATIAGLIFQGFPGKNISSRHLQSSSSILYNVLETYDPDNLLIRQARDEVVTLQLDYTRMIHAMKRINRQQLVLKKPHRFTPFSFPIMADRLREKLTSEKLADRIARLQKQLETG
jgi:ATP-dependent Lhr-like helicase